MFTSSIHSFQIYPTSYWHNFIFYFPSIQVQFSWPTLLECLAFHLSVVHSSWIIPLKKSDLPSPQIHPPPKVLSCRFNFVLTSDLHVEIWSRLCLHRSFGCCHILPSCGPCKIEQQQQLDWTDMPTGVVVIWKGRDNPKAFCLNLRPTGHMKPISSTIIKARTSL